MTRRPGEGYAPHADPHAVNLTGFAPPAIYGAGYYLLSGPHVTGAKDQRIGVDLATRERARRLYRIRARSKRAPEPWELALREVIELDQA